MGGVPSATGVLSPARRVRHAFFRLGLLLSVIAFIFVGGDVFLEQWIEGQASSLFIFGTACLIAAASILLFVFTISIGFVADRRRATKERFFSETSELAIPVGSGGPCALDQIRQSKQRQLFHTVRAEIARGVPLYHQPLCEIGHYPPGG